MIFRQLNLEAAFLLLLSFFNLNGQTKPMASLSVVNQRCENLVNPLGIEEERPRFSWEISSSERNVKQLAYQILVSDAEKLLADDKGNFWDSGKVTSNTFTNIPFSGVPLTSRLRLYWKVRVWDQAGRPSAWSSIASWEMGFLETTDWKAQWIGMGEDQYPDSAITFPAPWFRKDFRLKSAIVNARLRICGLGFYEAYLNGNRIGNEMLAPAQTNYDLRKLQKLLYYHDDQSRQRVLYNTYDVSSELRKGANVLGVVLGNGWYNQRDRTVEGCLWYNTPRLLAQLEITCEDGTHLTIGSDSSWKMTTGPLLHDGIFTGESYDARLELNGWNQPGYKDKRWLKALPVKAPVGQLQSQTAPPDRITRIINPVFLGKKENDTYIFDAKEMISGWVSLKLHGKRGDTIRLKHIEELGRDYGQMDTYIVKGGKEERYEPRFTWHAFRQIEVTGLRYQPAPSDLLVKVVNTDVAPAGNFECSNPLFNAIFENYKRTQLGNVHGSISSDCPHRERLGYTGDGQVAIEAAICSFDMTGFYRKWFLDMEDARNHKSGYVPHTVPFGGGGGGPAWGSGYVIMPWIYFQYYGDKQLLQTHYEGMKSWVSYLGTRCDEAGIVVREEPKGWCLGDWATPQKIKLSPELVNTSYYYYVAHLLSKIAGELGKISDQRHYEKLAEKIKGDFNRKFYRQTEACYLDGKQGANLFPMAFGMVPLKEQPRVFETIVKLLAEQNYHFDTGILATPLLLRVLTDHGRPDLAYTVMNQKDFPGYGNYIIGKGATTIWENWNGGSSHSHPMYGSVVAWFFNTLAGISPDPATAGSQDMVVNPFVDNDLAFARAEYLSVYGRRAVAWKKENHQLFLDIEIPANTTATIHFPASHVIEILEGNRPIINSKDYRFLGSQNGKQLFRIGSGKYHFVLKCK